MYKLLPMLRFYVSTNIDEDEKDLSLEKPVAGISVIVPPHTSTATSTAIASAVPAVTCQSYNELFTDQELYD